MEWLQSHISRIDNFCSNPHYSHSTKAYDERKTGYYGDIYNGHDITEQLLKYQQLIELNRAKLQEENVPQRTQSVSVIVTEKSRPASVSSIVPSPTSSVSDSSQSFSENTSVKDYDDEVKDVKVEENTAQPPSKRHKSEYSYKPAPMVRKSRRTFISDELKDSSYWERRRRNNEAAKKSRESRREKEIEISMKCAKLQKENSELKEKIISIQETNSTLKNQMQMYKEILIKNNLI